MSNRIVPEFAGFIPSSTCLRFRALITASRKHKIQILFNDQVLFNRDNICRKRPPYLPHENNPRLPEFDSRASFNS